ncbi:MAG TPA: DegT/DnrJ/EryC1/StrS family aminotransferase [Bacteroidales bacterium]
MKPIRMVDLQTQYANIKEEIDAAIQEVVSSAQYIKGPQVKQFEEAVAKYMGVKYAISCANGTDALIIALKSLDLPAGSEVIVPSFTFAATAEAAIYCGLIPVFADIDPELFTIDINHAEKVVTSKTKAIIPVHLFGQCADMTRILRLANKHKLYVIEDTAQAMGAAHHFPCGTPHKGATLGNIGCTSFFPSKNLGCFGDGGCIFTNDDIFAQKCRLIANHGMAVKYEHEIPGVNSRLDTIQAAILNVKLKYLDNYISARQKAAAQYSEALKKVKGIKLPEKVKTSTHTYNQYSIIVEKANRDELKKYLEDKGIPTMIYYPKALHQQKAFVQYVTDTKHLKNTEMICGKILSLPMHTELDEEQIKYVTENIIQFFK